jgi:hypothetical protein
MAAGMALCGAFRLGIGVAYADGVTSSPNPSVVGQTVTFTYSFTMPCDGAVVTFTIDGQSHGAGASTTDGTHFTAVYAMAFSTAGNHTVVASYDSSPQACAGTTPGLVQVVAAPAPPQTPPPPPPLAPPPPDPSPSPSAQPVPTELPSPAAVERSPSPASPVRTIKPKDSGSKLPAAPVALLVLASVVLAGGIYAASRLGQR